MTNKNKKGTNKTATTKRQSNGNKKKNGNRRKTPKMTMDRVIGKSAHSQALAILLADPCSALVDNLPGVTGETVIRRIRTIIPAHRAAANGVGYLIWYPEYHGGAAFSGGENANLFFWEVATGVSEGLRPSNTVAFPLGCDTTTAAHTCGDFFPDPANVLIKNESTPFASACTLAACMKYCYSGPLSSNSGFCYPIEDLPVTTFFNQRGGFTGTTDGAVSFTNLQTYAKFRARVPLEGLEVMWRPKKYAFRGPGETTDTLGFSLTPSDTLFQQGVLTTGPRTTLMAPDPTDISGFGIAWNGLVTTSNGDIFIECVKVVELQLRPTAGMVEERPATPPSLSILETAKATLDAADPGWQVRLSNFATHAAARLATTALAGASAVYMNQGSRVLRDQT